MKSPMLKKAVALTAAMMIQAPAWAANADFTLRFSHFFPSGSEMDKNIFQAWADKVQEESNGRIKVEMYASSTLSKPTAQYEAVKNRIADVTATIQGYNANRFPLTQVVELPGVSEGGQHGSCVIQSLYDEGLISDEYLETKPLFLFVHGKPPLHTTNKLIKEPEDLRGMRIRRPTAVVAKILEGLGAQPVAMPAPLMYQSLQRGVIDGTASPWEGQISFRLNELTPYHTELGGLYTNSFMVTMNKDLYNSMPADLQAVIDNNSGVEWSQISGNVFDMLDERARDATVKEGHEIYTVEGGINNPAWKPILDEATEDYLAEMEGKGLPARKVHARALELGATCK